jgi:hypothetical protein
MGQFKTEANKGVREYSPSISIAMDSSSMPKETAQALDKLYREGLIKRLKEFTPIQAKNVAWDIGSQTVVFNNNLDKPEWFWNDPALELIHVWDLRDIVILLENGRDIKK